MIRFENARVRELLLRIEERIIYESTPDRLLSAGQSAERQENAQSLIRDFRQFIEDNKDEIEAIRIFYSSPRDTNPTRLPVGCQSQKLFTNFNSALCQTL